MKWSRHIASGEAELFLTLTFEISFADSTSAPGQRTKISSTKNPRQAMQPITIIQVAVGEILALHQSKRHVV